MLREGGDRRKREEKHMSPLSQILYYKKLVQLSSILLVSYAKGKNKRQMTQPSTNLHVNLPGHSVPNWATCGDQHINLF